jgi:hypothetical protein
LIANASLALARLVLPEDTQAILENGIWDALAMTLEESKRFATKENVFKAMCTIVRNANIEQAIEIVNHRFFDILQNHIDLMAASPGEPLQALLKLGYIAISHDFNEWIQKITADEIIKEIGQAKNDPACNQELVHGAHQLLMWIEQTQMDSA